MEWSSAHAQLHILLRKKNLLPKGSRILIAVSGGQDSLCLTRLLIDLSTKWQWSLGIVHCDHRWREDSAHNAAHVLSLAGDWGVLAWDKVATTPPANEAAAREWRYEQFSQVATEHNYSYVVTGHTASDRAETVLYNLLRGTGTDGLGTLPWSRPLHTPQHAPQPGSPEDSQPEDTDSQKNRRQASLSKPAITLVRPLLNFTRQATADFCKEHSLPVWEDSSNQDLSFRRNRIRQELIPYLRSHFNPQLENALSQMAEITAADTAYLRAEAASLYQRTVRSVANSPNHRYPHWEVDRKPLNQSPLALQRRVMRHLLQQATASTPNFAQVEKLVALIDAPNQSQSDPFPGGWLAQVSGKYIHLFHA